MSENRVSKAWQILGYFGRAIPGILVYKSERIIFITTEGIQFNVPVNKLEKITWPILRMGLGFDAVIEGKKYKFSFAKPNPDATEIRIINGNPLPTVSADNNYIGSDLSISNLKQDKLTATFWKNLLKQA